MKAAVLRDHEVGLQIETLRTPRPKSGEVLIKVAACGLCHSDLHVIGGAIAFPLPAVLGHEVSGTIVELGPGNEHTGLTVGQKVAGGFLLPLLISHNKVKAQIGLIIRKFRNILFVRTQHNSFHLKHIK